MADATITMSGNLADDPTLRFTQSGVAVCSFTLMQNLRQKNQSGEWREVAKNGMRVTAWRDLAEHIAESFHKGERVIVTGRLEPQQWQDRDSGADRYGWQLIADDAGHSLRWATSQAVKAQRGQTSPAGQSGGWGAQQSSGDPWGRGSNTSEVPF